MLEGPETEKQIKNAICQQTLQEEEKKKKTLFQ